MTIHSLRLPGPRTLAANAGAVGAAFGVKAFYSTAGAADLLWILAPCALLARWIGGIDLIYEIGVGYVSHSFHVVVGPACAGVNFLVICFLTIYFSFSRHFSSKPRWLFYSMMISFVAAIGANSLRIVTTAYLWDAAFCDAPLYAWITPESMHRLAGTVIYYTSLLALYFAVDLSLGADAPRLAPLLWYLGVTLALPLAGRILAGGAGDLVIHTAWVTGSVILLTLAKVLLSALRNRIHCGK